MSSEEPDSKDLEDKVSPERIVRRNRLFEACEAGRLYQVRKILETGGLPPEDLNYVDETKFKIGHNPLIIACRNGHLQIVVELLKNPDIDVNICVPFHPLWEACEQDRVDIVKELLLHPKIIPKCRLPKRTIESIQSLIMDWKPMGGETYEENCENRRDSKMREIDLIMCYRNNRKPPEKFKIRIQGGKKISHLMDIVCDITDIKDPSTILLADIYKLKIFEFYEKEELITPRIKSNDDVYAFEIDQTGLHPLIHNFEECFPVVEYRMFVLIPKEYPNGRQTLVRRRIVRYPLLTTIPTRVKCGKELYLEAMSILRKYMVPNAREVLLQNSEGKFDLDDLDTLFNSFFEDEIVGRWRLKNGDEINKKVAGTWKKEEMRKIEDPFFLVECHTEDDTSGALNEHQKKMVHYHWEHFIDIKKSTTLQAKPNSEGVYTGLKHPRLNVRIFQKYAIGLFDESKTGEEWIKRNNMTIFSFMRLEQGKKDVGERLRFLFFREKEVFFGDYRKNFVLDFRMKHFEVKISKLLLMKTEDLI